MLGEPNPLADWEAMFDGSRVAHDGEQFVSFDHALAECRRTRASTISMLDSLDEGSLDGPSNNNPDGTDKIFGTYRRCFQYSADHWFMHRGQLADARRAAGLERMWF